MFATLSMGADDQRPDILESNTNPPGQKPQHSACDSCHDKKLKCSGRREGCDRCLKKGTPCTYLLCETNRRQKKRNRPCSSVDHAGPQSMPPHTNLENNGEVSKSLNHVAVVSDEAGPSKNKDHNLEQSHYAPDELPLSRHTEPTFAPSDLIGDMSSLDSLDPFLASIGTEKLPGLLDFDLSEDGDLHNSADTNLLMDVAIPSNEMPVDGLEINFGTVPLESPAESSHDTDHLREIGAQCRPSLEESATIPATDYTMTDVVADGSSFDPLSMSKTPFSSTSQALPRMGNCESNLRMHEPRQTNSPMASSPRNDNTSVSGTANMEYDKRSKSLPFCQCMQKVLVLYEEVETKRDGEVVSSTDYRLSRQNIVLTQCIRLIECTDCRRMSGFITLLLTISERLLNSFQRTSENCLDKLRHHQRCQRRPAACNNLRTKSSNGDKDAGEQQKVFVGGYEIESLQDQYCLILTVIELQLKTFRGFLMQLKHISKKSSCERHTLMLRPIDDGLQDVLVKLRQARNGTLDERLHTLQDLDYGTFL